MKKAKGVSVRMGAALFTAAVLLTSASAAHAQNAKPVTMSFTNLSLAHDSARAKARKNADAVVNDTLRYSVVFTNQQKVALTNVVFNNPIPQNLVVLPGSMVTSVPAKVEYSADGGKTYAAQPMVTVQENGRAVQRSATPGQYTHVRWTVTGTLAPNAKITSRFDARVGK